MHFNGKLKYIRHRPGGNTSTSASAALKVASYFFLVVFLVCSLAHIVATTHPWYVKIEGEKYYPAFRLLLQNNYVDSIETKNGEVFALNYEENPWQSLSPDVLINAPIPFGPNEQSMAKDRYLAKPLQQSIAENGVFGRHWLGTNHLGNDVLALLLHAGLTTFWLAFFIAVLAVIPGIIIGMAAGFYKNQYASVRLIDLIFFGLGFSIGVFYGFVIRRYALADALTSFSFYAAAELLVSLAILLFSTLTFRLLAMVFRPLPFFRRKLYLPLEAMTRFVVNVLNTLPKFLMMTVLVAVFVRQGDYFLFLLITGLFLWQYAAGVTQSAFSTPSAQRFIQKMNDQGVREQALFLKIYRAFVRKKVKAVFFIAWAYALLLESSLAFLDIGITNNSLGHLLRSAFHYPEAWWIFFPTAFLLTGAIFLLMKWGMVQLQEQPQNKL